LQQLVDGSVVVVKPVVEPTAQTDQIDVADGFVAIVAVAAADFVVAQLLAFVQLISSSAPQLQVFVDFLPFESFSVRREFFFFLDPFSFALPNHFYDFLQSFAAVLDDYFGFPMTSDDLQLVEFADFAKPWSFEHFGTDHRSDKPL
jgi:hypothetical protein